MFLESPLRQILCKAEEAEDCDDNDNNPDDVKDVHGVSLLLSSGIQRRVRHIVPTNSGQLFHFIHAGRHWCVAGSAMPRCFNQSRISAISFSWAAITSCASPRVKSSLPYSSTIFAMSIAPW